MAYTAQPTGKTPIEIQKPHYTPIESALFLPSISLFWRVVRVSRRGMGG
jgi:hypothetical protein